MTTARDTDLLLWERWKKSGFESDLQALLNQLAPLIQREVNRWTGVLPRPILESQAKIYAVEALRTFDPSKNVAISTHVTNRLQKLSRLTYTHAQALRLPEHKAVGMATFKTAYDTLQTNNGHIPTAAELADHLGWSHNRVKEFQNAYQRKEYLASGEFDSAQFPIADQTDPMVSFVYHDMDPVQQQVFEHLTGFGGKPILSNKELMQRMDLTQGQLSYHKQKIHKMFKQATL